MCLEFLFGLDLFLNFFQTYIDPETNKEITDHRKIANQYILRGWFFVDFISVFPFQFVFESKGELTKLFRLFRLPRLIKLIDISRFQGLLNSLMSSSDQSRDEKIVAQYTLMYVYKIIRLIIIAVIITYFIGCFWFYYCNIELDDTVDVTFVTANNLNE
jgi:hypothetical protein